MTPSTLLSSIRRSEASLASRQSALQFLWRRFGNTVRAERIRRRISLKAFAIDLGRTCQMVCMMESGVRAWPLEKAELAVRLLSRHEMWPDCPVGPKDSPRKKR